MKGRSRKEGLDRALPHALEAERAVLGAVLLENTALDETVLALRAEDFFLPAHRAVFRAMVAMRDRQQPVDPVTLLDELHRTGHLESAGGPAYVASIGDGMPRATNVAHWAAIVRDKSLLRQLVHTTASIQQQAMEAGEGAEEMLDRAEHSIFELGEERARRNVATAAEMVEANWPGIEQCLHGGRRMTGLATGYAGLDELTGGLQPSELVIIAARPSVGKSALALNIAENVAMREGGLPVALFSLEMTQRSLLDRLVSSVGRVDGHKFRTGGFSKREQKAVVDALARIARAPLVVDDSSALTVAEIAAKCRRMKREKGLALAIVDYLQLLSPPELYKEQNRTEAVGAVARALKSLARELAVPLVALSQLTRSPGRENRRPQLHDLRESGEIEQHSDAILFIHRKSEPEAGKPRPEAEAMEIIVGKQRNGPTGPLEFVLLASFTRFEEAARHRG